MKVASLENLYTNARTRRRLFREVRWAAVAVRLACPKQWSLQRGCLHRLPLLPVCGVWEMSCLQRLACCCLLTKASRTGWLVGVCERSERLGGLGGPLDEQLVFRVGFGNVLQGYVPGGKWVPVRYRFPPGP